MEHQPLTRSVGVAPPRPRTGISPTARAWLFLSPSMLFLAVLILASLLVLRMSVGTKGAEWTGFSLASYAQLLEPYYLKSLLLTLRLALFSAVMTGTSLAPNSTFFLNLNLPTTGEAATGHLTVPVMSPSFVSSGILHSSPMAK